jgi:arabinosyltransferase C
MERQQRNLVAALALAVICLSSVFWLRRDIELLRLGVSKTAVHNLHLTTDEQKIIDKLNEVAFGKSVLAIPGIPAPTFDQRAFVTDLSPIVSGLTGAYTYAGHWSETPNYTERRNQATAFFTQSLTTEQRAQMLRDWKIDYVVAPMPTAYEGLPDLRDLGQVVYEGEQLALIKVSRQESPE